MATKRWQGRTSGAWPTAANWIGGEVPVENDDVQMLSEDRVFAGTVNITAITKATKAVVTCGAHSYVAGDLVLIAGVTGMTQINGARVVDSVDATHVTLTVNSTGFGTYTGPSGTVAPNASYCTTGPSSAITITSLTITVAANQNSVGILGTNGGNVSVSTTFSFVEDAGTETTYATMLGSYGAGTHPILLSGCTGTLTAMPNWTSSPFRSFYIDTNAGATLTIKALPCNPDYGAGNQLMQLGNNSVIAGTVTVASDSSPGFIISGVITTGTLNLDAAAAGAHNVRDSAAGTINVNAASVLGPRNPYYEADGLVINANAPTLLYDSGSADIILDDMTINAAAPVTLANFGVLAGKTLTVSVNGAHEITQVDVTGTVIVDGTASIAQQYAADQAAVLLKEANIEMGQTVLGVAGKLPVKVFEV